MLTPGKIDTQLLRVQGCQVTLRLEQVMLRLHRELAVAGADHGDEFRLGEVDLAVRHQTDNLGAILPVQIARQVHRRSPGGFARLPTKSLQVILAQDIVARALDHQELLGLHRDALADEIAGRGLAFQDRRREAVDFVLEDVVGLVLLAEVRELHEVETLLVHGEMLRAAVANWLLMGSAVGGTDALVRAPKFTIATRKARVAMEDGAERDKDGRAGSGGRVLKDILPGLRSLGGGSRRSFAAPLRPLLAAALRPRSHRRCRRFRRRCLLRSAFSLSTKSLRPRRFRHGRDNASNKAASCTRPAVRRLWRRLTNAYITPM